MLHSFSGYIANESKCKNIEVFKTYFSYIYYWENIVYAKNCILELCGYLLFLITHLYGLCKAFYWKETKNHQKAFKKEEAAKKHPKKRVLYWLLGQQNLCNYWEINDIWKIFIKALLLLPELQSNMVNFFFLGHFLILIYSFLNQSYVPFVATCWNSGCHYW